MRSVFYNELIINILFIYSTNFATFYVQSCVPYINITSVYLKVNRVIFNIIIRFFFNKLGAMFLLILLGGGVVPNFCKFYFIFLFFLQQLTRGLAGEGPPMGASNRPRKFLGSPTPTRTNTEGV